MNHLDDDEEMVMARARLAATQTRKKPRGGMAGVWKDVKRVLKGGHKVYEGERLIHIGNPALNAASKFSNNSVSTSKYNLVTFLPKFLAGE
jgi:phospholipid-transporting ATPase